MIIGTYGFKIPETSDKGAVWFPAMSANMARLDTHNHDGVNSAPISATSLVKQTQNIPAGATGPAVDGSASTAWSLVSGVYEKLVTMPTSVTFAGSNINFRDINGDYVHLGILQVGASSYKIFSNDNTLAVTAIYD